MGDFLGDEPNLGNIKPHFTPNNNDELPRVASIIKTLSLESHIEGGYFRQTDVAKTTIPSPYPSTPLSKETVNLMDGPREGFDSHVRQMSTTIFYFISPNRPQGHFHRNRSRIIHTLHRGRARYVLIHPDGRIETYVVGHDIANGEKLQWIIESGVWKACYLLPDADGGSDGMLISETVAPGFEYADHEFLSETTVKDLLPENKVKELDWLVRKPDLSPEVDKTDQKNSDNSGCEKNAKDPGSKNEQVDSSRHDIDHHRNGLDQKLGELNTVEQNINGRKEPHANISENAISLSFA